MIKSSMPLKNPIKRKIGNLEYSYFVEHRPVRYPRLEFKAIDELLLILPLDRKDELDFLTKKEDWIAKKIKKINVALELVKDYQKEIKNKLLIFGKFYELIELKGEQKIEFDTAYFKITTPTGKISIEYLKNWFKNELKQVVTSFLDKYSKELRISYNNKKVIIRMQQTKWASCTSKNYLNFNLKSIMLPLELIEYVVLHEILHLKQKKHNYLFWKKLGEFFPDYEEKEMQLLGFWFLIRENNIWRNIEVKI